MSLGLDIGGDRTAEAERLASTGRTRLGGFLTEGGEDLMAAFADPNMVWMRAIRTPYNTDVPVAVFEGQPPEEQARLIRMVHEEAADDFQFIFDRLKLGEARALGLPIPPVLYDLHAVFNSEAFLDFARRFSGDDRIAYVDAQPTRYLPGHFLNTHTDEHVDAGRLYAYVLNLSPRWRPEWGGLLMFMDGQGTITETFTPTAGTLNVFKVPQNHAVSMVAPFARAPRYSITGWWRTTPPGQAD